MEASKDKKLHQWWHYDMDRPKWLKFFIYLTDCDEDNGPHCSKKELTEIYHSMGNKKKGYSRIPDDKIFNHYNKKDIVEIIAKRGNLIN